MTKPLITIRLFLLLRAGKEAKLYHPRILDIGDDLMTSRRALFIGVDKTGADFLPEKTSLNLRGKSTRFTVPDR